jgi:Ser/Thr protein kinase RdoA (MazF antagonist)
MNPVTQQELVSIIQSFQLDGTLVEIVPVVAGHINDTFASRIQTHAGEKQFIHQRINSHVFHHPEHVMENIIRVLEHARCELETRGGDADRRVLSLVPTLDGQLSVSGPDGETWRTYRMIEGARTYDIPEHSGQVYHAARAFGQFQHLLSTLPGQRLHETIPNFHHTPLRFEAFERAMKDDCCGRVQLARTEIDFILARQADTVVAVDAMARGELPERVTHNDTKLNNVLIDDKTGEGICVLDLDTVMPGTVLYDFGDMVRSGTATSAEDEPDLARVGVDLNQFRELAAGYTETAREFLTPLEWELLPFAGKLITLEQAIRFLGDYLQGDTYYKTHRPGHNLDRARVQIKMVAEMEAKMGEMEAVIRQCRDSR